MNTKHDLLEFWEWQKINIEAHIKSGYIDHAIMVMGLMKDVLNKSQRTDVSIKILHEIEMMSESVETKKSL